MKRLFVLCGVFSFFSATPLGVAAETVLHYSLTETRIPLPLDAKKKEIASTTKKEVILGNDFFSVKDGEHERIYDFKNRRIHYLDHRLKTHADISLYADLAFRAQEFKSRLLAAEAIEKSGGAQLENFFTLESIFGIEGEKKKLKIEEVREGSEKTSFFYEKESIAETVWEKDLPTITGKMFGKFLIYDHSMHPQIRKKILSKPQIPKTISYQLQGAHSRDSFRLVLERAESRPDRGYQIPGGYASARKRPGAIPSSAAVVELVESVISGKNKIKSIDKAWFWSEAEKALQKNNHVGAALFFLEYGFQTGDSEATMEAMQKIAKHQAEDPDLDRFLRSLGVSGKEQASRAVLELQKLDRKKLNRAHVLDVMIANQKVVLGKNEEAEKDLLGALKINPYMAGVYKDLGDLFYSDFDTVTAWLCWDFGRSLAPRHFALAPIYQYEKELVQNFPDFF